MPRGDGESIDVRVGRLEVEVREVRDMVDGIVTQLGERVTAAKAKAVARAPQPERAVVLAHSPIAGVRQVGSSLYSGALEPAHRQLVERVCRGGIDDLRWGDNDHRHDIMCGLAIVRAAAFKHERWSYKPKEDCPQVVGLIKSGSPPSRIAQATYGASRDRFHRDELGTVEFRQLANKIEVFIRNVQKTHVGRIEKGDAIRAWRTAYDLLPAGRKQDWDDEKDFTVMTADQIMLEVEDMTRLSARKGLVKR